MVTKEQIAEQFRALQLHICEQLELLDGEGRFTEDTWQREEGGGGIREL